MTEAYQIGYAIGVRQHTSGYQQDAWPNVALPVCFLDKDFRDPDLEEFLELVDQYEPDVAVIGDAATTADVERYHAAASLCNAREPSCRSTVAGGVCNAPQRKRT